MACLAHKKTAVVILIGRVFTFLHAGKEKVQSGKSETVTRCIQGIVRESQRVLWSLAKTGPFTGRPTHSRRTRMKSLKAQLLSALVVMWIGLLALAAWSAFSARARA